VDEDAWMCVKETLSASCGVVQDGGRGEGSLQQADVLVIHGDVVVDARRGTSVLSGDDIVRWCAKWVVEEGIVEDATRDLRCVFCSDVFGVYDAAPTRTVEPGVCSEDCETPMTPSADETATRGRQVRRLRRIAFRTRILRTRARASTPPPRRRLLHRHPIRTRTQHSL
jgi:hypothetical protein